jgi:hypothetical protein
VSPEGTLWVRSTCATATIPGDFTTFAGAFPFEGVGRLIVDEPLCLWLTNEDFFYDVIFSNWGSVENGNFEYERTAVDADECGVATATCGATCGCPVGWVNQGGDGICVLPDPCDANPCGAGATCRKTGAASHRCECGTVSFTKPAGQTSTVDCVSAGVCIARGDMRALYNSLQESEAGLPGQCDTVVPTFTEWALEPCASAAAGDFGDFLSPEFSGCDGVAWRVVGVHSCLHTTDDDDALWDIQFTDWCPKNTGGCFSYNRWHAVGDGVACP